MSQAAISEMSEDEVKVLLKSLNNLTKFFHSYVMNKKIRLTFLKMINIINY